MVKNLPTNAGDASLIPGWGRSPGGGNGNPLQYSCLENSMDRGGWWVTVPWGHKESDSNEQLTHTHTHTNYDPGIKPRSPTLQADALTSEPPGKAFNVK